MKRKFTTLGAAFVMMLGLVSCHGGGSDVYCWTEYDIYGYPYTVCDDYYYASEDSIRELDMAARVAESEAQKLEIAGLRFAEKYNLSADQGYKIAKNIADFTALEDRSNEDMADFAEKLYGVNPSEVVSAVGQAQVGMNGELENLIEKAAYNFNTDTVTMKTIINDLHGKALSDNGIEL